MFENGLKRFMEIEDAHFKRDQKQRRFDQKRLEEYKNIF